MNPKRARVKQGIGNRQSRAMVSRVLCSLSILLGLLSTSFPQTLTPSELIHVEVSGMHNDKGQIVCALFRYRHWNFLWLLPIAKGVSIGSNCCIKIEALWPSLHGLGTPAVND